MTDHLRTAQDGRGGVLLVEGRFGTGKTLLLDQAAEAATDGGFTLVRGAAEGPGGLMPLAPLTSALGESIHGLRVADGCPPGADLRLRLVEQVQDRLEQQAARGPVLVTLDDLHWADPTTVLALRLLIPELSSYSLVWMLSRMTGEQHDEIGRFFDILERDGAVRVVLDALDPQAVVEIIADVLDARPGPDLLALVGEMADTPFALVELLRGLRDEGAVHIVDGDARLVSREVPQRIKEVASSALARLGPQTRRLLRVAAVLGRSFQVDDLAEMLGEPTCRLLPELEEAAEAGAIVPAGGMLTFRHHVLWRSIAATTSAPRRRELHEQAADMLLRRGGSAVRAATHLMIYAQPGDRRTLTGLDQAAQELLSSSPQTAAELALRALDLTTGSDPGRSDRTATAVHALTIAGRLPEAIALTRQALGRTTVPEQVARLRCELAYVLYLAGHPADAVTEAENVLSMDDLPGSLRGPAHSILFRGLLAGHEYRSGRRRAQAVLADQRHPEEDEPALVWAHMLLSHLYWAEGRVTEALGHARDAVRVTSGRPVRFHRGHPRLELATMLADLGDFEEAESTLRDAVEAIAAAGHTVYAAAPGLFRAFIRLAEDRLDDAVAEAEAGLAVAESMGTHAFSVIGITALALVATRKGDLEAAARYVERYEAQLETGGGMMLLMAWGNWGMAVVAEARGDREAAAAAAGSATVETERAWLFMTEPSAAAWLTRVALAVGDRSGAEKAVDTAERLARDNPAWPLLGAPAAHARGLLRADAASLEHAAATYAGAWNRASASEDLGVLLEDSDRAAAISALDRAGEEYQRIGALRDATRVRVRLRALGLSHRRWNKSTRPSSGWDSLTDTERDIAALVAQGLTNPQVAERMYVSPHTVKFHLRQVFRKLGVASRVELARTVTRRTA